ncbi:hypothetical protein D018_3440B, partial [Vibrio parahaemolyticus VP2007-007]
AGCSVERLSVQRVFSS